MVVLKIFISYASVDKKTAGDLKVCLEKDFGIEVFVAHHDIEVGTEWNATILDRLANSDLFIPLLSKEFHSSCFTNQEVGYALGTNKIILPLKITTNPQGFISKLQALTHKSSSKITSRYLITVLIKNPAFKDIHTKTINSLILTLQNCTSLNRIRMVSRYLRTIPLFSPEQILALKKAFTNHKVQSEHDVAAILKDEIEDKYKLKM